MPPLPGGLPPMPPAPTAAPQRPVVDIWGDLPSGIPPPAPPSSSHTGGAGAPFVPPPLAGLPPPPPGFGAFLPPLPPMGGNPPPHMPSLYGGAVGGDRYQQQQHRPSNTTHSSSYSSHTNSSNTNNNNNREATNTVWLGGGVDRYKDDHFISIFAPYGRIMKLSRLAPQKQTVFVHYRHREEAQNAVREVSSRNLLGPDIRVGYGKQFEYTAEEMALPYNPSDPSNYVGGISGGSGKRSREDEGNTNTNPYGNNRNQMGHRAEYSNDGRSGGTSLQQRSNVLWVGEIPNYITTEDLRKHFSRFPFRELSRNENKGIAFVHFETVEECEHVMSLMRDLPLNGHMLKLNYGTARKPKEEYHDKYGGPPPANPSKKLDEVDPSKEVPTNRLFVGGLPYDIQRSEVDAIFGVFAGFLESRVMAEKHFAFIDFDTASNCATCRYALLPNPVVIRNQTLRISFARDGHNNTAPTGSNRPGQAQGGQRNDTAPAASNSGLIDFGSNIYGDSSNKPAPTAAPAYMAHTAPGPAAPSAAPAPSHHHHHHAAPAPQAAAPVGAMSYLSRQRPAPVKQPGVRERANLLKGVTYSGLAEGADAAKSITLEEVQAICTAVDNTTAPDQGAALETAVVAHLPRAATHVFCVVAKRLFENYNNDPARKVAVMTVIVKCVLRHGSGGSGNYSTASVEALLTLIGIASIEQQSETAITNIRKFLTHIRSSFLTIGGSRAVYEQAFVDKADLLIKDIEVILAEQEDYLKLMA